MTLGYDPAAGRYVGGPAFGLGPAVPPPISADLLERLVRFEHPAKVLGVAELPGAAALPDALVAAAYATTPAALAAVRDRLGETVRAAADALLADPSLVAAARALPVGAGATVVALGDSITDDLLSWAEILRYVLAAVRPDVRVVNAGVSGDTTADALRRLYGIVAVAPDLVITMLGTNDCQRHGPAAARLVSARDGERNAAAIADWLRGTGARLVWLTPPPVDEAALAAALGGRDFALRDADTRAFGPMLARLGDPVVDVRAALGPRLGEVLLPDGVHPTVLGQQRIAAALLRAHQNQSGAGNP